MKYIKTLLKRLFCFHSWLFLGTYNNATKWKCGYCGKERFIK